MLRGLDDYRVPLLAIDPLSSDWPCTLLGTAVNYYYFIMFLCLIIMLPSNHSIASPIFLGVSRLSYNLRISLCPFSLLASAHRPSANLYCLVCAVHDTSTSVH